MPKITKIEYGKISNAASPRSKSWFNIPKAFIVGGLICALGECVSQFVVHMGGSKVLGATICSVSLILLSVVLTALNVFDKIAKHAGAGTLVPITGFANAVVAPAIEFKTEGLILGLGAKMFIIAGPVIVYGLLASTIYGVIYYLVGLIK